MDIHTEEQEVLHNSAYNPFPEPQTIPSGWDMSEFLFTSQSGSGTQFRESSESDNHEAR
jgi:hypothetical protein